MRPNRTFRTAVALLLALLLPLQGYAAMPACGHQTASPVSQHHCDRSPAAAHHPSCGDCCGCAAPALTSVNWSAPRPPVPEFAVAEPGFPPAGILDRLDRPPRLILA
jgi:hypothetical protein